MTGASRKSLIGILGSCDLAALGASVGAALCPSWLAAPCASSAFAALRASKRALSVFTLVAEYLSCIVPAEGTFVFVDGTEATLAGEAARAGDGDSGEDALELVDEKLLECGILLLLGLREKSLCASSITGCSP